MQLYSHGLLRPEAWAGGQPNQGQKGQQHLPDIDLAIPEAECLKLVFAVLWRASERWRRVQFSEHERKQLERYIEERQRQKAAQKEVSPAATVA